MNTTMDRQQAAQALAKVWAYKQCGNEELAREWMARLIAGMGYEDILVAAALGMEALAE